MILLPIGDVNPAKRFPFVNYLILAANVAIGLAMFLWMDDRAARLLVFERGFIPADWTLLDLITSQFLHGGWMHLVGNMLFLWIVGDNVEDKLGHFLYPVFYLLSGVAAGLAHWGMDPHSDIPCIGASGAISGVLAAYAVFFPRSRIRVFYAILLLVIMDWGVMEVPALLAIGFWFLQQLLYAAGSLSRLGDMQGVAYGAHVGGFVFGLVVAVFAIGFGYVRRQERPRWK